MLTDQPCPTCPWRKSSTVGGADIPGFSLAMMRGLRNTVGDDDAFRPVMACHYSAVEQGAACRGYVYVEGYRNLNVRLLAARDVIPLRAIDEACAGLDLWPSFAAMLAAYEEAHA